MLRFLTDADLNAHITRGLRRRIPDLDVVEVRDIFPERTPDSVVLEYAARQGRIVISHDVNTMTAAAVRRVEAGEPMPGLFIVSQSVPIGQAVNELELRAVYTEEEEWQDRVEYIT